jgi:hypothetical protein
MTKQIDPWRAWAVTLLLGELVAGLLVLLAAWSLWDFSFGDDATGEAPYWHFGPPWLAGLGVAIVALLIAAMLLALRPRTSARRVVLGVIAVLHFAGAALGTNYRRRPSLNCRRVRAVRHRSASLHVGGFRDGTC